MSVIVYGSSDDRIELAGDFYEEFSGYGGGQLAFSNGVLLSLEYGNDGVWHISVDAGEELVACFPARGEGKDDDEDGVPGYSQKAYVTGPVLWVVHVEEIAYPKGV